MALNTTTLTNTWRKLVSIVTDTATLRYADTDIALDDGTVYDGRVVGISELRRSVGRLLDPKLQLPQMRLDLDNRDDTVRNTIDTYELANRTVNISIGQGEASADYENIFTGVVKFPNGIEWDDSRVVIRMSDIVSTQSRVLPINKFFPSTYPNVEEKSKYLTIPILYGDWRTTAGNGEQVPCYCDDTTAGTGGHFTIANHAIKDVEAVYKNGVSVSFSFDYANGGFTLNTTYDPAIDTITANCRGATDDGTPSGNLIQTLPDILEDILTTWLGATAGQIDSTAFTTWGSNLSAINDLGRRWIGQETSSNVLIADLLVDGFADLTIVNGKYTPVYRVVEVQSGIPTFRESDIVNKSESEKAFQVTRDEELVYANQIVIEYSFDPIAQSYSGRYDVEDSSAIATVKQRRRRRIQSKYLYTSSGAQDRADRELYVFGSEVETAFITFQGEAVTLAPTDQFRLFYSKYGSTGVGTPFQIREITVNPLSMTAKVKAWNMLNLTAGRWTNDSATTWLLSTADERNTQGYWTDNNGYADTSGTPSEASKRSKWF